MISDDDMQIFRFFHILLQRTGAQDQSLFTLKHTDFTTSINNMLRSRLQA